MLSTQKTWEPDRF